MEKTYTQNTVIRETTAFSCLTISEGVSLAPPEGKLLTMTVDGVHRDPAPGTYRGLCLPFGSPGPPAPWLRLSMSILPLVPRGRKG